jgi:hypothetical protein
MKLKSTLLKTEDALEMIITDSFPADLKRILKSQREITNNNWKEMLESGDAYRVVNSILKTFIRDECKRGKISVKILTSFSRSKSVK